MPVLTADAVVVGGGHHGLVAAALLADAGWDVCLLEATDRVGGAVRSDAAAPRLHRGPVLGVLPALRRVAGPAGAGPGGARAALSHAPVVLAHPPRPDGERAALLFRDREATAARLAEEHPRDGDAWLELCRQWDTVGEPVLRTLFTTFPPVRGPMALLRADRDGRGAAARPVPAAAGAADGRGAVRRARARGCCSRATPRTPTRRSTPRSAAPTAGCWRCSGSSTGSRCRSGVPVSSPRRSAAARRRRGRRCTAASRWTGSTSAAAGPSPCTPRPG